MGNLLNIILFLFLRGDLIQIIQKLYNDIIISTSKPVTIRQLASNFNKSYNNTYSTNSISKAVKKLQTAGILIKTKKNSYRNINPLSVKDLIKHPFMFRSKHTSGLIFLLNIKPLGIRESSRLLGTSPSLIQKAINFLYKDKLVEKTSNNKYVLKQHIISVELLPDDITIISAEHLLNAMNKNIIAVLYSQGEFLITIPTTSYYSMKKVQSILKVMVEIKIKGIIMSNFDWMLYLAGGFKKTPSLSNFMLGIPVFGMPWFDRYNIASEFLSIGGEESLETNIKKALVKGIIKKDKKNEQGLYMTDMGVEKILSRIRGDVKFTKFQDGISLAKFR